MSAALGVRAGSAAGAALLLLSACATLPPAKPAPPPAPLDPARLGLSGAQVAPAANGWWRTLGDPQLDTLIERTLSDNPGLAETTARLQAAQSQVDAARANELPTLRLSGGETRLKVPSGFGPYLLGGQSVWLGNLGARFNWDLDLSRRQSHALAAARDRAQAATLDIESARLLLAAAVTQTYISLYRSYALADVAAQAEEQRGRILDITRRRVSAGLDTRVELREAEGALPQAHLVLLQEQSSAELLRHELAALSGRGADAYASIGRPGLSLPLTLQVPSDLPINLLARRPDVIAARWRVDAADSQLLAARAAFYPSVNLSALVGFASISLGKLLSAESFGYGAGPAFSLPLFDAGRLRAQYRGAEADLDAAAASYNDTVLGAVREVSDQLTQLASLEGEIAQQRRWADAAEEAYRLAEERYRAGLATYLSVLNAETEVLNARRQSVELMAAQASARVTLLLTLGGSFQPPQSGSVRAALPAGAAPSTADSTTKRIGAGS
jgi:NodT family efflux transporter outer membrane factor (OMF) lipoprotein